MSSKGHVAVVAFPYGSHAAPLLAAVRRMAAASRETVFSFIGTAECNRSVLSEKDVGVVRGYELWDGLPEDRVVPPTEGIELFMLAASKGLRPTIEAAEADAERKVTCLVTDAFFWFALEMALDMDVPWVPFWTAGPASLSAHLYTDVIRAQLGHITHHDSYVTFVPGMSKVMIRDLPKGVVLGDLSSFFSQMLHKMGLALPRATAVFINSFEEIDQTITCDLKARLNNFLSVGPLSLAATQTKDHNSGCLSWLNDQAETSVAYISNGTAMVPPKEEVAAIARALEESKTPFVWSLRDGDKANLPKGFQEATKGHGMVVAWAPQTQILSHKAVGVFVTHFGWNSVLESIAGGVPMIGRPFLGDQSINGRIVQDVWNIGLCVQDGGFTKEGLQKCLSLVLSNDQGKIMRENIVNLKHLAEEAVVPTGSSTINFKLLVDVVTRA